MIFFIAFDNFDVFLFKLVWPDSPVDIQCLCLNPDMSVKNFIINLDILALVPCIEEENKASLVELDLWRP